MDNHATSPIFKGIGRRSTITYDVYYNKKILFRLITLHKGPYY